MMAVYVDQLRGCIRSKRWPYDQAAHLVADTLVELREFALRLGLKQVWIQNKPNKLPHYDLSKGMYFQAIRRGAIEIDDRQLVEMIRKNRERAAAQKTKFENQIENRKVKQCQ